MAIFALGLIWVFAILRVIRLSRYVVLIRAKRSCLYHTCKKNVFSRKYMLMKYITDHDKIYIIYQYHFGIQVCSKCLEVVRNGNNSTIC